MIYLVGETHGDFNGSELQKLQTGGVSGRLFDFDLEAEQTNQAFVLNAIRQHLVTAAHDLSDGGLLVALAEMGFANGLGAKIKVTLPTSWGFSETQGRFLITVAPENQAAFEALNGSAKLIGHVQAAPQFDVTTVSHQFSVALSQLQTAFEEALPWYMNQKA